MQVNRYTKHGRSFAEIDTPAGKCILGPVDGIDDTELLSIASLWAIDHAKATAALQERARKGAVLLPHGNDPV